jgi:ABC-type polysaccharide/polyol phosphate transport system ATPase subunit
MNNAVIVKNLSKSFRLYHERNQFIKAALLRGRRARYEEFWALKDIDLEVPHGTTFGIVGSNGSGKSTLLKCLAGILSPEQGSISVSGRIAPLLELGAGFHPELSGRENVYLNGAILGRSKKEIDRRYDEILDFADIGKFIDSPIKNYSSGMYVRLAFAIAINVEPEILMVDEVLGVGDAAFQRKCAAKIEQFRTDGHTIIFVSHGMSQVEQLCDQAVWLEKGHIRMLGTATEIVSAYSAGSHDKKLSNTTAEGRWGSGEVQIRRLVLEDDRGDPRSSFEVGGSMNVVVKMVKTAEVQNLVVKVKVANSHGAIVWESSSRHHGLSQLAAAKQSEINVRIDPLQLTEGVYSVSVSLTDRTEQQTYDHLEKGATFEVDQSGNYDTGIVVLASDWAVRTFDV